MIPQARTGIPLINKLVIVTCVLTIMVSLPLVVSSLILRDSGFVFSLAAINLVIARLIWFTWEEMNRRGVPGKVILAIKYQKEKTESWFDYSTWFWFEFLHGPEMAYHSDIFIEPKPETLPEVETETEAEKIVKQLTINTNPGFIYVMRREDGILKIGKTNDTKRRLIQHIKDYEIGFELVYRFAVADATCFEKLALKMTSGFEYKEPGRVELRKMTSTELEDFILLFRRCCVIGVDR